MLKVLITGGGSEEPVDNVRSICNFSTGRTSAFLADFFTASGCEVTEIAAEKAVKPSSEKVKVLTYRTFAQLKEKLESECTNGKYDAVIHAAAVSDYSPSVVIVDGKEFPAGSISKIPAGTELTVKMHRNPKLVDSLKKLCGKNTKIVAFKLTSNANAEERKTAVNKIFSANENTDFSPDFVVSNDLSEINEKQHPCKIFAKDMTVACEVNNLTELAEALYKITGDR